MSATIEVFKTLSRSLGAAICFLGEALKEKCENVFDLEIGCDLSRTDLNIRSDRDDLPKSCAHGGFDY